MPHLINPGGRLVAVDDPAEYDKLLGQGFTIPPKAQVEEFVKERYAQVKEMVAPPEEESSIYMATVTQGGRDGYGVASKHMIKELQKLGSKISVYNKGQKIGFLFHNPYSITRMENPVKMIYTMFESDKIPDDWPEYLEAADKVFVPSQWCMEVFAKAGINAEVIPLGYDANTFKFHQRYVKREKREDFVFLHYNAFNIRKGFLEVLKAFVKAFDPSEPVKMIFKTTLTELPALKISNKEYPNIIIEKGPMPDENFVQLLNRSDCFVFPSRGEGFGIPPLEAMATGMPAIVPNAHGISEYFNSEYMYEAPVTDTCPGLYSRYKGQNTGNMVVCGVDELAAQMRWVYEHQDEALEMGKKASEYVKQWTFEKTAQKLKVVFDEYMAKEITPKGLHNVLTLEEVK